MQPGVEPKACVFNLALYNCLVRSSAPARNHYTRQLTCMISFLCHNNHSGVLSPFYYCTRALSCPVAPSHPKSNGKPIAFPKSVPRSLSQKWTWNSGLWTALLIELSFFSLLLLDLSVFLASHYGKSIPFFTHPLLSLASCHFPDIHAWFSQQMNLNRKGIQGHPNVVLLRPFFWAQCLEQERSSLYSIL